jgi:DNA polymerase I
VHDELVLEAEQDFVSEATAQLRVRMEGAATLDVPLLVDVGVGDDWEAAH